MSDDLLTPSPLVGDGQGRGASSVESTRERPSEKPTIRRDPIGVSPWRARALGFVRSGGRRASARTMEWFRSSTHQDGEWAIPRLRVAGLASALGSFFPGTVRDAWVRLVKQAWEFLGSFGRRPWVRLVKLARGSLGSFGGAVAGVIGFVSPARRGGPWVRLVRPIGPGTGRRRWRGPASGGASSCLRRSPGRR